jgi:trigger factor
MQYTHKHSQSSYQVTVTFDDGDIDGSKEKVLKQYQKDVKLPGFRKGHVPLRLVEQQVNDQYMQAAIYEQLLTDQLREMVEKESDVQWIGNPYDIDRKENTITYRLDVYPTVQVLNDDWKTLTLETLSPEVTDEQRDEVVQNFKKQYADRDPVETVSPDTVATVQLDYLDADGEQVHTRRDFVGREDQEKDSKLGMILNDKKKDDVIELKHTKKELPADWIYTKDDAKPKTVKATITDIKKMVLPTFDRKKIVSLFGEDAKPQNEEELIEMITESTKIENYNQSMMQAIE